MGGLQSIGKFRIGSAVGGDAVRIVALHDEEDYCSRAGLTELREFSDVFASAFCRCIGEQTKAVFHKRDRLYLHPAGFVGILQKEIKSAAANAAFPFPCGVFAEL